MKVSNKFTGTASSSLTGADSAKASKLTGADGLLESKKTKTGKTEKFADDSAKVELSSRAQDIKKARELATPDDSIDEAKVARLQALIDAGKYKVDAEAIADRLIDEQTKMPS